jgi:hypothetical protein
MGTVNWYVAVGTTSCFAAAYALRDNALLSGILVALGGFAVFVGGAIAIYFAVWNPDRLHSEEHLTQLRQLDLIESKGGRISLNPVDLRSIANPYQQTPALPAGEQGEGPSSDPEDTDG